MDCFFLSRKTPWLLGTIILGTIHMYQSRRSFLDHGRAVSHHGLFAWRSLAKKISSRKFLGKWSKGLAWRILKVRAYTFACIFDICITLYSFLYNIFCCLILILLSPYQTKNTEQAHENTPSCRCGFASLSKWVLMLWISNTTNGWNICEDGSVASGRRWMKGWKVLERYKAPKLKLAKCLTR